MDSGAWRGFPFDWYPPALVLAFPFPPMLAAFKHSLPIGDQWLYEPKLDGFRGLLRHATNGHVQVLSRNLRDLAPSFPELGQAARSLPAGRCWTAKSSSPTSLAMQTLEPCNSA